jgi:hypothetical protein
MSILKNLFGNKKIAPTATTLPSTSTPDVTTTAPPVEVVEEVVTAPVPETIVAAEAAPAIVEVPAPVVEAPVATPEPVVETVATATAAPVIEEVIMVQSAPEFTLQEFGEAYLPIVIPTITMDFAKIDDYRTIGKLLFLPSCNDSAAVEFVATDKFPHQIVVVGGAEEFCTALNQPKFDVAACQAMVDQISANIHTYNSREDKLAMIAAQTDELILEREIAIEEAYKLYLSQLPMVPQQTVIAAPVIKAPIVPVAAPVETVAAPVPSIIEQPTVPVAPQAAPVEAVAAPIAAPTAPVVVRNLSDLPAAAINSPKTSPEEKAKMEAQAAKNLADAAKAKELKKQRKAENLAKQEAEKEAAIKRKEERNSRLASNKLVTTVKKDVDNRREKTGNKYSQNSGRIAGISKSAIYELNRMIKTFALPPVGTVGVFQCLKAVSTFVGFKNFDSFVKTIANGIEMDIIGTSKMQPNWLLTSLQKDDEFQQFVSGISATSFPVGFYQPVVGGVQLAFNATIEKGHHGMTNGKLGKTVRFYNTREFSTMQLLSNPGLMMGYSLIGKSLTKPDFMVVYSKEEFVDVTFASEPTPTPVVEAAATAA